MHVEVSWEQTSTYTAVVHLDEDMLADMVEDQAVRQLRHRLSREAQAAGDLPPIPKHEPGKYDQAAHLAWSEAYHAWTETLPDGWQDGVTDEDRAEARTIVIRSEAEDDSTRWPEFVTQFPGERFITDIKVLDEGLCENCGEPVDAATWTPEEGTD